MLITLMRHRLVDGCTKRMSSCRWTMILNDFCSVIPNSHWGDGRKAGGAMVIVDPRSNWSAGVQTLGTVGGTNR